MISSLCVSFTRGKLFYFVASCFVPLWQSNSEQRTNGNDTLFLRGPLLYVFTTNFVWRSILYSYWPCWKIKLPRAHPLWKYDSLLPLFRYLFPPPPLLSPNVITRPFQVKILERAFTYKLMLFYLIFSWKFAFVEIVKFYEFWDVFKLFQVSQKL